MRIRITLAALLAVAAALFGFTAAQAEPKEDQCERTGNNAGACDFDGDEIPNSEDPCRKDPDPSCVGEEDPGTDPGTGPDPAAVIAGIIEQVTGALPAPPEGLPTPPEGLPTPPEGLPTPPEGLPEPPAELPTPPSQGDVEAAVAGVVSQLPAPPAP